MEWLILLIVCAVLGGVIGSGKGIHGGALAGLLLGPLGVLIVAVWPNQKKQKMEEENLALQRAQLQALQASPIAASPQYAPPPPPPGASRTYRIASNGEDLGEMSIPAIKRMISGGQLTMKDHYLDPDGNEWVPLDCLPGID